MSIRQIIFRPMFFVSFSIFVLLSFVLSAGSTQGFNLFKAWTVTQNLKVGNNFVRTGDVESIIVGTVLSQLKVGNNQVFGTISSQGGLEASAQAQELVHTDILNMMAQSNNPERILQLHLAQMEQTLEDMKGATDAYTQLATKHAELSSECLARKNAGDQQFFDAVGVGDTQEYEEGLAHSIDAAPCYITNRIYANAYTYLAQRAGAYDGILRERFAFLSDNQNMLVQSYPLLGGDAVEQLVGFKQQLAKVNTVSFGDVGSFFSFGVPDASTAPSLQGVWFQDNDLSVPTYLEPTSGLGK